MPGPHPYLGQVLFPTSLVSLLEDDLCGTEGHCWRPGLTSTWRLDLRLLLLQPVGTGLSQDESCLCLSWLCEGGELARAQGLDNWYSVALSPLLCDLRWPMLPLRASGSLMGNGGVPPGLAIWNVLESPQGGGVE